MLKILLCGLNIHFSAELLWLTTCTLRCAPSQATLVSVFGGEVTMVTATAVGMATKLL